jgi:hypothetical protein
LVFFAHACQRIRWRSATFSPFSSDSDSCAGVQCLVCGPVAGGLSASGGLCGYGLQVPDENSERGASVGLQRFLLALSWPVTRLLTVVIARGRARYHRLGGDWIGKDGDLCVAYSSGSAREADDVLRLRIGADTARWRFVVIFARVLSRLYYGLNSQVWWSDSAENWQFRLESSLRRSAPASACASL